MRPMIGNASALSNKLLFNSALRRALTSPHAEQSPTQSWICQRCYQHRQHAPEKGREVLTALVKRLRAPRQIKIARAFFSTSRRRAQANDAEDARYNPRSELPSQEEGRRSHLSKRFSLVMDHLQSNIFIAGQRLNDLTGYSGIEALKKDIEQQGQRAQSF